MTKTTEEFKTCTKCKTEFLIEEFYTRADRPGWRVPQCKYCTKAKVRETQETRRARVKEQYESGTLEVMEEKWCRICDEVKPSSQFYMKWDSNDYLSHACKSCHKYDCKVRARIKKKKANA